MSVGDWSMQDQMTDWAVTKTLTTPAQIPRGLVVRIWRSHRRGSGSIPGVGICVFLLFWGDSLRQWVEITQACSQ